MTSYVIARTLGDPTASTTHKSSFAQPDPSKSDPTIADLGTIPVTATSPSQGEGASPLSAAGGAIAEPATTATIDTTPAGTEAHPSTYFIDEDDGAARLAGVGVFSPVSSMPGSPTLSRRRSFGREEEEGEGSGESVRRVDLQPESGHGHERNASGGSGLNGGGGGESTSGESSFTMLEREESFEDPAAAHIRRRVPGPAGADAGN